MSTTTLTTNIMAKLSEELRQDLGVLYGMGVKNPQEPEAEEARHIAMEITAPWQLLTLVSRAGVSCCPRSYVPTDVDAVAAVVGAFYARVRSPTWLPHPEAARNTEQAKRLAVGRVLASAAQTLTQGLVALGYKGSFEGSPQDVADSIRDFLEKERP